jgi:uncharacterized protein with ParB-like and HNH nuclease domain
MSKEIKDSLTNEDLFLSKYIEDDNKNTEVDGVEEGDLQIDSRKEVILNKSDRSLQELHNWFKDGDLIIDPEWQRQYVWNRKQASKLIESYICDIPIPVIYLAENKNSSYEVIDGLQRLTSTFHFFEGKYKLDGLNIRKEFNGMFFKDLAEDIQKKLKKTTIRTFELSSQTSNDLKFIIFERLNTGGVALNEMEIRNCLYRGKLNTLIKELAKNEDFVSAINQKNLPLRMGDRALVLRFLAFYERTHTKAKNGLKNFLNDFLDNYKDTSDEKLDEYQRVFKKCMRACVTVFGDTAFRLLKDSQDKNTEWAGRPNAAIFQVIASSFSEYDIGQITRSSDLIMEEYLDLITNDSTWIDYVRRATGEYTRIDYVFRTWQDRLKEVLKYKDANDSERCFSNCLKQEMYNQNQTCSICGQKISILRDAAMDHNIHYWRGGKTIPENARLVHRLCNSKREK